MPKPNARVGEKLRIFISYSRRNAVAADALVEALTSRGFDVTIDRRDLPFGEKWQSELAEFIRLSDTVVWLVSEPSVRSEWVNWELDEVARRNKRLVPLMIGDMQRDALPRQLGEIHILPAEGTFALTRDLDTLVRVLETDHAWLKQASRLQDRAAEWLAKERARSLLLSRGALRVAEQWKEQRPPKAPAPAQEVLDLMHASGRAATRRQRWWVGGSLMVAAGALTLAGVALWQRTQAEARLLESRKARVGDLLAQMDVDVGRYALQSALQKGLEAQDVESLYAARPAQTETAIAKAMQSLNFYTRFRSADYRDMIKFAFMGEQRLAYATDNEIFMLDLPTRKLLHRVKLPGEAHVSDLKWIDTFNMLAVRDKPGGRVFLIEDTGSIFADLALGEEIEAFAYSDSADAEVSLAALSRTTLFLMDPSEGNIENVKRIPLGAQGADPLRASLTFDASGKFLYWPAIDARSVVEHSLETETLTTHEVYATSDAGAALHSVQVVPDKDRALIACSPCVTFGPAGGEKLQLGHELTYLAGPASANLVLNPQAIGGQLILFAKLPAGAFGADAPNITLVGVHLVGAGNVLMRPVLLHLEDKGVAPHSVMSCGAADVPVEFLVCRTAGSSEVGDGLLVWRVRQEQETPASAIVASASSAAKEALISLRTWHELTAPFGE